MVRPVVLKDTVFKGVRGKVASLIEHRYFIGFITTIICINAVTLGLETSETIMGKVGTFLHTLDMIFLMIFVVEIALKLFVYRLYFFRAGWNVFDFLIVGISILPASGSFTILRALRIFRVLRLLSVVPQMRRVVSALLISIPGMTSIISVLLLIFYVSAVLATQLFGSHPAADMQEMFGTIARSMYTLFEIMTLEGWSEGVADPTMVHFPWAWIFFVPFIVITSFAVLNLFIGIIVDAMHIVQQGDLDEESEEIIKASQSDTALVLSEIRKLRKEVEKLKSS